MEYIENMSNKKTPFKKQKTITREISPVSNQRERILNKESSLYYEKSISDDILEVLLGTSHLSWTKIEALLDQIYPALVSYGYKNIAGIKELMDKKGVSPNQITNFKTFEEKFPLTTISEILDIGYDKFKINNTRLLLSAHADFEQIGSITLSERKKKFRKSFNLNINKADARAATIAMASQLRKEENIPQNFLINQKKGDNLANSMLSHVIVPALEVVGAKCHWLEKEQKVKKNSGLIQSSIELSIDENISLDNFSLLIDTTDNEKKKNMFSPGAYASKFSVFPHFGLDLPFPSFTRVTNRVGQITRKEDGTPQEDQRGLIIFDRLFSAYEIPTSWSILVQNLRKAIYILIGKEEIYIEDVKELCFFTSDEETIQEKFEQILKEAEIDREAILTQEDLWYMYCLTLNKYYKTSIRIGFPQTFLLKLSLDSGAELKKSQRFSHCIPVDLEPQGLFVPGRSLKIKHEEVPYLKNIVGGINDFPHAKKSLIRKRVRSPIKENGEDNYLYDLPIINPQDFKQMLDLANKYATEKKNNFSQVTFTDVLFILKKLFKEITREYHAYIENQPSMIGLLQEKTQLPINELKNLIKKIENDFLAEEGLGLKKILYSALINGNANYNTLPNEQIEQAIGVMKTKEVKSPSFMVTPGNIALYDSFFIMAQVLLASLSNSKDKRLSLVVRPSQSDIAFNYLAYTINKITKEYDAENKKGLRSIIQKAYWDPRYDPDFLKQAIKKVESGIYYGTAETYREVLYHAIIESVDTTPKERTFLDKLAKMHQFKPEFIDEIKVGEISTLKVKNIQKKFKDHKIYTETISALVLFENVENKDKLISNLITQIIGLKGADCTKPKVIFLKRAESMSFINQFKKEASKLHAGDTRNFKTDLSQYDPIILENANKSIKSRKNIAVVKARDVLTEEGLPLGIDPNKGYTGIIFTTFQANEIINSPRDIKFLSKEIALPWINFVIYDTKEEVLTILEEIRGIYKKSSGYPRFLYLSSLGDLNQVEWLENKVKEKELADLFKKKQEAFQKFTYYRPHQGDFFINKFLN
jgi:hypothetical protein